jgi:large subunit ribosomal protein L21
MSFAVIKTGGKQYVVREGEVLTIEKLPKPENGKIIFDEVLLTDDGKKTVLGTPFIKGAAIEADFVAEGRGKKITIIKYKNKTNYRKKQGHRQHFTKVTIKKV